MRHYKCMICDQYRDDVVKCNIYRPGEQHLPVYPLCPDCARNAMEKGWLVLKCVGQGLDPYRCLKKVA